MLALLAPLLSSVFGSAFSSLVDGYKAKLAAMNTTDKLAVDLATKEIEAEIVSRTEATKVLTLENGRWWTWLPRSAVQWAASAFFVKCVVYDTLLGFGETPALHGAIDATYTMVMAMWFGGRTIEKVAQIFKR